MTQYLSFNAVTRLHRARHIFVWECFPVDPNKVSMR